jgi:hypothetical protein
MTSGFALDNEGPRHSNPLQAHALGLAAGQQRRIPAIHRRRRLCDADAVAVFGLGFCAREAMAGAVALGRVGGWLRSSRWPGCGRWTRRAGLPCQPVRGRRLRLLGRRAPAHGSRMGGGGLRLPGSGELHGVGRFIPTPPGGGAGLGNCSATCGNGRPAPYTPYPGCPIRRRHRRIQRQIHVQPVCVAAAALAPPRKTTSAPPTAISSSPKPAGNSAASALPNTL